MTSNGAATNAMQAVREDVPFLLDLIDKQARALEIAREELDGRFCFCEENICTRCKALTAIDEVLK